MYPKIKNKTLQALNDLSTQVILIMRFILNEMYPLIKNKAFQFLGDPDTTLLFITIILLILISLIIGSGSDLSGG